MQHVAVDFAVVELEAREQRVARAIMHEFRTLVEIRRVVLVALDDDMLARAEPEIARVIERDTSDNERGSRPASARTWDNMADVVVFPCVPATTTLCRPRHTSDPNAAGKLICGIRRSRTTVASGFTRRMTLPMITRSGLARSMFSALYGENTSISQDASMSLMGG